VNHVVYCFQIRIPTWGLELTKKSFLVKEKSSQKYNYKYLARIFKLLKRFPGCAWAHPKCNWRPTLVIFAVAREEGNFHSSLSKSIDFFLRDLSLVFFVPDLRGIRRIMGWEISHLFFFVRDLHRFTGWEISRLFFFVSDLRRMKREEINRFGNCSSR